MPSEQRHPPWVADELMLALDLYLVEHRVLDRADDRVIRLSDQLGRLGIHSVRSREPFRTTDAVVMKLANFRAIDPDSDRLGFALEASSMAKSGTDLPISPTNSEGSVSASPTPRGELTFSPLRERTSFSKADWYCGYIRRMSATDAQWPRSVRSQPRAAASAARHVGSSRSIDMPTARTGA